ncbi:MAG: hemolysin III family protein [Planctomycetes bacterium]|nr:hemolysin III family protein [Planctomycetota bacterium]
MKDRPFGNPRLHYEIKFMTSPERPADELANLLTHVVGLVLSVVATGYLMLVAANATVPVMVACGFYSGSLIAVYCTSTLSHLFHDTARRRWYRALDQASIYLLITGTYTPLAVIYLSHGWWPVVLVLMWVCTLAGIVRVIQVRDLSRADKFTYGILGLMPIVSLFEFSRRGPASLVAMIVAGGACYLVGTVFLRLSSRVRYSHAVWHLLVMAGSACHYRAILIAVS